MRDVIIELLLLPTFASLDADDVAIDGEEEGEAVSRVKGRPVDEVVIVTDVEVGEFLLVKLKRSELGDLESEANKGDPDEMNLPEEFNSPFAKRPDESTLEVVESVSADATGDADSRSLSVLLLLSLFPVELFADE